MISERVKGYSHRMKGKPTKEELAFDFILKRVLKKRPYLQKQNQLVFEHPYGYYIVDFYIGALRLGFEIDGGYHWNSKQLDKDLKRDYFFDSKNIKLIHIPNSQVSTSGRRKHTVHILEKAIEERIGELRKIEPFKYKNLVMRERIFLIAKLIAVLKQRLSSESAG